MKKISVDLPDELYKKLMKIQYEEFERTGVKPSLREIINNFLEESINKKASKI